MTYRRVIPRDLFNEGNLLKCYGQLYLCLEKLDIPEEYVRLVHMDEMDMDMTGEGQTIPFIISQDESDGSLTIDNVMLQVDKEPVHLYRPLNSREPFPLYAQFGDTTLEVFTISGNLNQGFLARIRPTPA